MHIDEKKRFVFRRLRLLERLLPPIFWMLLLFGFDSPLFALNTLISAAVHELGHISVFLLLGIKSSRPTGHISGFRILPKRSLSFSEDALVSLGGPLANLVFSLISLSLSPFFGEYAKILSLFSALTMLSNLAPIEGQDGYRIILALTSRKFPYFEGALRKLSFAFNVILLFLSLYLIEKIGSGYWIFALFCASALSFISKSLRHAFFED